MWIFVLRREPRREVLWMERSSRDSEIQEVEYSSRLMVVGYQLELKGSRHLIV
jgi:hypothetical protein